MGAERILYWDFKTEGKLFSEGFNGAALCSDFELPSVPKLYVLPCTTSLSFPLLQFQPTLAPLIPEVRTKRPENSGPVSPKRRSWTLVPQGPRRTTFKKRREHGSDPARRALVSGHGHAINVAPFSSPLHLTSHLSTEPPLSRFGTRRLFSRT